jgi:hypothetical protein
MTAHLLVEGDFVRASLYFGRLTAVTYSGNVARYPVPSLSSTTRLDLDAIRNYADRAGEPEVLISEGADALAPPSDSEIISLHSYDGATYLGARDGLWAIPDSSDGRSVGASDYFRLVNRPALDIDATFGVAAVAHGDGVSVIPLNARWLSAEHFRPARDESGAHLQALTWVHHDIVGRLAPFVYEVIPGEFELRERDQTKHYVFKALGAATPIDVHATESLVCAIASRSFAVWDRASGRSTLFARTRTGWSVGGPVSEQDSEPEPTERELGSVQGRVISLREFGPHLVCELGDRLSIVDVDGRESIILDRAVTDVRVYPRSRRYRGIMTAVSELGVHLLEPG